MAILDSVIELAKRFSVETEEQTISEMIDAINQKLDDTYPGSRDIEEAVSQFAKNDGPDARLDSKTITENGTYTALSDDLDGYSEVTVNVSGGGGISPSYITFGEFNGSMPPGSGTLDNRSVDVIIVTPDDNGAVSYSAVNTVGTSTMLYNHAFVYGENVKRINLEAFQYNHCVTFKAGENFEGFYYNNEQMSFEGTITAGTWYNALYSGNGVVVETNEYLGYTPMT